ncbi:MAG: FAD-binding domain-containing protein [Shimia sp.]
MLDFPPTRAAALDRLADFAPQTGRDYASLRNYDLGAEGHPHVSTLSPYLRHRMMTEEEVLRATLSAFAPSTADKFISEVYWRAYFKGWLEHRPSVWGMYRTGLDRALNRVQTEAGLRAEWEAACKGETGIDPFDHWADELVRTGYLHNHARMWFASIWMFTLRLPWELGADFFLRHLLDGDPASNTLSWRWVGGLHTPGKTYLARTSNIAKYTKERFRPTHQLATEAEPVDGFENPRAGAMPSGDGIPEAPHVLILHEDDLHPEYLFEAGARPVATAVMLRTTDRSPLEVAPKVQDFARAAAEDAVARLGDRLGPVSWLPPGAVAAFARDHGAEAAVTPYAPVGPAQQALGEVGLPVHRILRRYDEDAWPHATKGFFALKKKIPALLGRVKGLAAV